MKNEMKHTPGPWAVGRALSNTNAVPIRKDGENIAWVCGLDSALELSPEETAANAALIAAAPELLRELKILLNLCERYAGPCICGGELTEARAAIAKAKGTRT